MSFKISRFVDLLISIIRTSVPVPLREWKCFTQIWGIEHRTYFANNFNAFW